MKEADRSSYRKKSALCFR